jgi:signal transduction histidine kinase
MQTALTKYLFHLTGILLLAACFSCNQSASDLKRILVIQSYEPEYDGYIGTEHKILHEFKRNHIKTDIRTFYLDCESYMDKEEKARIYNYLDSLDGWRPDIVLTYDDQACYSFMNSDHPLSKQVPTIFAGVNYPNWNLLKKHPNITGYWDRPEFLKTIKMSEDIYGPMRINIWTDNTYLGKQTTGSFLNELKAQGINYVAGYHFTVDDKNQYILTKDSSLIIEKTVLNKPSKTFYVLTNGRETESAQLLWALSGLARYSVFVQSKRDFTSKRLGLFSSAPTITVINEGFGLKEGLLGGYITPYHTQIELSVKTASEVLRGKPLSSIPITKSPKEYLIDWEEMVRWNIPLNQIPSNYQIVNMPFFEKYKSHIISFGICIGITVILLIIYLTYLYLRENRNKQQAQESLRKGEQFLSLALAGGNVFAFQLRNNKFYFDRDFYTAVGLKENPFSIEEFRSYILPQHLHIFNMNIEMAISGDLENNISQIQCKFNDKDYQWWEFRYTYNKQDDFFSGLCLNIQRGKEAEQELIYARQKAEESDKMKSAFLANMSHEIRTPLNAIVGFSNIIAEEDVELSSSERNDFLKLINTNSDLLLKLINDILDLSRIESGRMEFSFSECNLSDLMNNVYQTHRLLMPEGVELKIEKPEEAVMLNTDKHRLTQVITNFINNASKFTRSGYIKIGYSYNPKRLAVDIFVEDTGIGIPKEKQKAVFERFNKLDEFAQGTGLGLAICQVIIHRFGGVIELESEENKGSCFTISLPLVIS